jgi:hypothetical protein
MKITDLCAARSKASFTDHDSISQHITILSRPPDEIAGGPRATPLSGGKTA